MTINELASDVRSNLSNKSYKVDPIIIMIVVEIIKLILANLHVCDNLLHAQLDIAQHPNIWHRFLLRRYVRRIVSRHNYDNSICKEVYVSLMDKGKTLTVRDLESIQMELHN